MTNIATNLNAVRKTASALGELNEHVAFVGGSVVSLYADDLAAEDVRPTKDVDITVEIATPVELERLRQTLISKGFRQSHEEEVLCRFLFEDIKVDVMSTKAVAWAPSNRWFAAGLRNSIKTTIDDQPVRLLSLPYFLASKFAAFRDRGNKDPRGSHDFEDIVYVMDNRRNLAEEILQSPPDVKTFLQKELAAITKSSVLKRQCSAIYNTKLKRRDLKICSRGSPKYWVSLERRVAIKSKPNEVSLFSRKLVCALRVIAGL